MARRKGKSDRRIKDWHQKYVSGEELEDVASRRQKLSRREVKLREDRFASEDLEGYPVAEGMVTGVMRRGAMVRVGGDELFCGIAKTYRAAEGSSPLAVGDFVAMALTRPEHTHGRTEIDRNRMDGMILTRRPRETLLIRPQPRSGKRRGAYDDDAFQKVIVANMEVLLVVAATVEPPLRHGLIDRFGIIAERGELSCVLVINKIDLARPDERVLADFAALEMEVRLCSALTGEGMDDLKNALVGRRSVLAGASGVGKSTLINAMVPGADIATRPVRSADRRGRHTTSTAAIFDLPGGGMIVDTPGIRELGVDLEATELTWYFPEFEEPTQRCRFRDCTHTHEPDCAIRAAVEAGDILPRRYESYLRILGTLGENLG